MAILMTGSIVAVARVAADVYARGLIHGGARISWRTALRARERAA